MATSLPDEPDTFAVHAGAPAPAPAAQEVTPEAEVRGVPHEPCPRCGAKLVNPGSLGWCMKCGYCKSLEEEPAKKALFATAGRKNSTLGLVEFFQLLQQVPVWVWILLGGSAAVVGGSFVADSMLPLDSFSRAVWSTSQVVAGILLLLGAQIWALCLIVADEDTLSAKDVILPGKLWRLTLKRLPETRKPVWCGTWACATIASAVFILGGFSYWYQFYQPKKLAARGLQDAVAAVAAAEQNGKTLEEAVKDFANMQDLTKKDQKKKEKDKVDKRPAVECVIIGYLLDEEKGGLGGLVLATLREDALSFAGIVRRGYTPEATKEMLKTFAKLERPTPLIRGLRIPDAIWLKPEVFCEVQQSGWDRDGQLIQPSFKRLLQKQP